jgi:SAM-dependent methyltransferase
MTSSVLKNSYSHTSHFVGVQQFNDYIQGLLNSNELDSEKKLLLQAITKSEIWSQIQQSSYWRHNIFNKGLNGPFTEYFACFNPQWKVDFWGERVQLIDIKFLDEHALPRAYKSTVWNTQQILAKKVDELLISGKSNVKIASLACGTMYDVLGTKFKNPKKVSFCGIDADKESLRLAEEKAKSLGYDNEQIKTQQCDIVSSSLTEDEYDVIICNGFSFYIKDESLIHLIENVKRALKTNGIFLMSFIQPPTMWQMDEEEKKVDKIIKEIYNAVPMNWSTNLRTSDEVLSLVKKGGLSDVSILEEKHHIHPLILAHKR